MIKLTDDSRSALYLIMRHVRAELLKHKTGFATPDFQALQTPGMVAAFSKLWEQLADEVNLPEITKP